MLDADDFEFRFLVKGIGGLVMPFSFLIGGGGEVSDDDEVAGLPLKLFQLEVSASASGCKLDCFWKLVSLPFFFNGSRLFADLDLASPLSSLLPRLLLDFPWF